MKFTLGFLVGLGAAWAALAIWQRVPEFPDIDADGPMDDIDTMIYRGQIPASIRGDLVAGEHEMREWAARGQIPASVARDDTDDWRES